MDADAYLHRLDLPDLSADALAPDRDTLARLLEAHVTGVPFENLAIVGDPHGEWDGDGVSLRLPDLYRKIVDERRGGFCFELNGLFNWLLGDLGYDADRCAARIGGDEDSLGRPPANHHTNVVHLDRRYLVDAGSGTPQMREPVPLDGTVVEDRAGVAWRVDPDDAPLSDFALRLREPGADDWHLRYRFRVTPRQLAFFEATCEFLANEPDGTFTAGPIVQRSTAEGYLRLDADTLTRTAGAAETATPVAPDEWHDVLEREFDLHLTG
jgi:N-hydroxyarylamine O-acetyltransferase